MGLFNRNKEKGKVGLIADVIRCDEPTYLIWKWHPEGSDLGKHKREYSIRWGSRLRVKSGEVAVFVYRQKDGTLHDYLVGPREETLKTINFPVLTDILGAGVGGNTPFQAEVYFVNLEHVIQTKFAVPFFDVCDPRFPDFAVPVAVRGTITFGIYDYREFIKMHRLDTFTVENFKVQIKDAVCRYVKGTVASAPNTYNIPAIQLESKMLMLNNEIEENLKSKLKEAFGVAVSSVDVEAIELDKTSDGYQELAELTKTVTASKFKRQTDIDLDHYEDSLRVQREESQYAMHKQTQTANIGAFQIEKQAEVGIAGADALGKMGSNNAGAVNLGGSGMSFNPASMMASMAVGNVVGRNIASTMNDALSGGGAVATPPPIPKVEYFVAKNGKPTGPFEISKLVKMISSGDLTADSLVWKQGMANWEKANSIDDLKGLFPPPII